MVDCRPEKIPPFLRFGPYLTKFQKSSLKRVPTSPVEFTEEQLIEIEKVLDKIEDDDDIQQVFTNIA